MDKRKRISTSWETLMNSFTDDLWTQVLLRLPIKSLLRFKLVSKSWFSIISSHRFAKSHLAIAPKDDQILIVHHEIGNYEEDDGSFSLFQLDSGCVLKNLKFPYSQGEYPSDLLDSSEIIGSDCGIVCVCVPVFYWPPMIIKYDLYLWNPATKHSKLIPPCTILDDDHRSSPGALGFGFDHIHLDFKLVRVVSPALGAEVYSSNRNTWRKIHLPPANIPSCNDFYVCLHGFLFALGFETGMTAFNLNKEVFICDINLPVRSFDDTSVDESYIQTRLTEFKDTLAVITCITGNSKINLWTLDDERCLCGHGVEASWTKVQIIDIGVPLDSFEVLFNNAQFLLIEKDEDWILYNFDKKVITHIPEYPYLKSNGFSKYTKSLFSLQGFKLIKWAASSSRSQDSWDWVE